MADHTMIDLSYLISICDDDKTFKIEMIETFLNDIPPIVQAMNDSLSVRNWVEIGSLAHKIKPSFTFMGIEAAKHIIIDIERNGKETTNLDTIPVSINELNRIMGIAIQELSSELDAIRENN